ncbi:hypothetical protein NCG89_16820 [Spongiibacter taiwanensis]|uniref:hypothetical protein n=1 Tax=Spongiibacter taiwanensis TaxID=1748242 RepID=UPI002034E5A4|nr:hypothetical protein [Spongiibacter taiwanensis]USA43185.1 hypothetical protein NCG89_16820 [Spongiibacter taiwanensis]
MGTQIGLYLGMIFMQLLVALPVYYIIKWRAKSVSPEKIALAASVLILLVAWVTGFRYAKDVAVEKYKASQTQEIMLHPDQFERQKIWHSRHEQFVSNPENIRSFHISAIKTGVPSSIISIIFLLWLADRNIKKRDENSGVQSKT